MPFIVFVPAILIFVIALGIAIYDFWECGDIISSLSVFALSTIMMLLACAVFAGITFITFELLF